MTTAAGLVVQAKTLLGQDRQIWFQSAAGEHFLNATDRNLLSFTWEAKLKDGSTLRQYDDITFYRALRDKQFIPSQSQVVSTESIPKKEAVEYILFPIAYTRSKCPWYQTYYRLALQPEKGQRLIARWLTDYIPRTGYRLRRHVMGIAYVDKDEQIINQTFFVLSPSGEMVLTGTEDVSYDGE